MRLTKQKLSSKKQYRSCFAAVNLWFMRTLICQDKAKLCITLAFIFDTFFYVSSFAVLETTQSNMWSVKIKHCYLDQSFNLILSTLIIFCKFNRKTFLCIPFITIKIIMSLLTCGFITVAMFLRYPLHIREYIITN